MPKLEPPRQIVITGQWANLRILRVSAEWQSSKMEITALLHTKLGKEYNINNKL